MPTTDRRIALAVLALLVCAALSACPPDRTPEHQAPISTDTTTYRHNGVHPGAL